MVLGRLLTVREVAQRLNVSQRLVRAMLREGRLPGLKLTRMWRVPEESLYGWISEKISESGQPSGERKSARGIAKHLPFSVEQFLKEKREQVTFEEERLAHLVDSVAERSG